VYYEINLAEKPEFLRLSVVQFLHCSAAHSTGESPCHTELGQFCPTPHLAAILLNRLNWAEKTT